MGYNNMKLSIWLIVPLLLAGPFGWIILLALDIIEDSARD